MKQGQSGQLSPPSRADARHEAAHAVVSVRADLPLDSTSIQRGHAIEQQIKLPADVKLESVGYTTLVIGSVEAWAKALPDPGAQRNFELFAAQAAAGICAELSRGAEILDLTHRDDLQSLVQIAGIMGIGESTEEPAVWNFIASALTRAESMLSQDEGMAWERVTAALFQKNFLTGAEVRAIVGESDASRLSG